MMIMASALRWKIGALLLALSGCATLTVENAALPPGQAVAATPTRWRVDDNCMLKKAWAAGQTRENLALACPSRNRHDLIGVALSGGGSKAAIFAGETLFYLEALGLLQQTSLLSAVSGGSFAGALYALSCDPKDEGCKAALPDGRVRPVWQHDDVLRTLGQGYGTLIQEQVARIMVPLVPISISAGRFAEVIDHDYLKGGVGAPFRFADLNPRRPHLFLNATITSENRAGLGSLRRGTNCPSLLSRGYLRRRTPDEFFHFTFSDTYFGLLNSETRSYPLASAIAASAAFPALIDLAQLTDHCTPGPDNKIKLMDGGANDNQALIEIYLVLAELVYGQHRSGLWQTDPASLERLNPSDRAFVVVVNSSVTETTGDSATGGGQAPHGALALLSGIINKVLTAADVASAEGYNLRKQSYLLQGAALRQMPDYARVIPTEVSLTALDQYWLGGTEAALRYKAGFRDETPTDLAQGWAEKRRIRQQRAYNSIVPDAAARRSLGLSDIHPQCYFAMRKVLDASLISLHEDDQACLRDAARWATALRAQELCDPADNVMQTPDGLLCKDHRVQLRTPAILPDVPMPGICLKRAQSYFKEGGPGDDPHVMCQKL